MNTFLKQNTQIIEHLKEELFLYAYDLSTIRADFADSILVIVNVADIYQLRRMPYRQTPENYRILIENTTI